MAMASRAVNYWRSSIARAGGERGVATSGHASAGHAKVKLKVEYVPVCVAVGLIAVSAALGLHTARLQLAHAPGVWVDKRKRETVPEVAAPEWTLEAARRFIAASLFRRVAHLQDFDAIRAGVADPTKGPVSATTPLKAETLKDVGVELPEIGGKTGGTILRNILRSLFDKNH